MARTEIAGFRPKSYKTLQSEARKTVPFQREINGMGIVQGELINDPEYVSEVRLVADFVSDSVSGNIYSFRDSENRAYRIDIELEGGTIGTSDFGDDAVFGGTLSGTNVQGSESLNFTGSIAGQFLGARGDMILGSVGFIDGFTGKGSPIVGVFTAEQP